MKSFMDSLFGGVGFVGSSFGYIRRNKMSYVYIWIAVLAVIFFMVGAHLSSLASDYLRGLFLSLTEGALSDWATSVLSIAVGIVARIATFMLVGAMGGCVILVLMGPIFSIVAEKTTKLLTGLEYGFSLKSLMWGLVRGVGVSLYNFVVQTSIVFVLFLIGFVPFIGLFAPVLAVGVNAFYFGVSMADYSMEPWRMGVRESLRYAHRHRGTMVGIGLPFTLSLFVPIAGPYIALIFAPATAVAAARALAQDKGQTAADELKRIP